MRKKALTLLEVIIATTLLVMLVAGIVGVFISAKRYILHSRMRTTAGELGQFFLNPVYMHVRADTWSGGPGVINCFTNLSTCPGNQTIGGINYRPLYSTGNVAGTGLRWLKANITWNETAP